MILVMLGGLAFVFPVAVYFLLLANLNRRTHPVMVSGPWDFSEVLLACSGFLIFGGICVITGFNERWRNFWLHRNPRGLQTATADFWYFWLSVIGLYFLVLLAVAVYLLWRRRLATAIYNIELSTLQDYISLALDRLGLNWQRIDHHFFIAMREEAPGLTETTGAVSLPHPSPAASGLFLELDDFRFFRHITLYWSEDQPLREEIEAELARALAEVQMERNPIGAWMIGLAVGLFGVMVLTLGTMLMVASRR